MGGIGTSSSHCVLSANKLWGMPGDILEELVRMEETASKERMLHFCTLSSTDEDLREGDV